MTKNTGYKTLLVIGAISSIVLLIGLIIGVVILFFYAKKIEKKAKKIIDDTEDQLTNTAKDLIAKAQQELDKNISMIEDKVEGPLERTVRDIHQINTAIQDIDRKIPIFSY